MDSDRRLTIREIASLSEISPTRVHDIIHTELHMSKLSARWVLQLLTPTQKENRAGACRDLFSMSAELGESFWSGIITVHETWLPFFMPETKEQPKQWSIRTINKVGHFLMVA